MILAKADIDLLIVDSSYASLENVIKHHYRTFGVLGPVFTKMTNIIILLTMGVSPKNVAPENIIDNYSIPIFIIHGENDKQIPVQEAYILKRNNNYAELWIVPGANHGTTYVSNPLIYQEKIKE